MIKIKSKSILKRSIQIRKFNFNNCNHVNKNNFFIKNFNSSFLKSKSQTITSIKNINNNNGNNNHTFIFKSFAIQQKTNFKEKSSIYSCQQKQSFQFQKRSFTTATKTLPTFKSLTSSQNVKLKIFSLIQNNNNLFQQQNNQFGKKYFYFKEEQFSTKKEKQNNDKKQQTKQKEFENLIEKTQILFKKSFSFSTWNEILDEWIIWIEENIPKKKKFICPPLSKIPKQNLSIKTTFSPFIEEIISQLKKTDIKSKSISLISLFDKIDKIYERALLRNSWKYLKQMLLISQYEIELIVSEGLKRPLPPFRLIGDEFEIIQNSILRIQNVLKSIPYIQVIPGISSLKTEDSEINIPIELNQESVTEEKSKEIFLHLAKSTLAQIYDIQHNFSKSSEIFEKATDICKIFKEVDEETFEKEIKEEQEELKEAMGLENRIKSVIGPQAVSESIKKNLLPDKKILYKGGKIGKKQLERRRKSLKEKAYQEQFERLQFLQAKYKPQDFTSEKNSEFYPSEHKNDELRIYTRTDESLLYNRWAFHFMLMGDFEKAKEHLNWSQENTPLDDKILRKRVQMKLVKVSEIENEKIKYDTDDVWPDDDEYNPLQNIWRDD